MGRDAERFGMGPAVVPGQDLTEAAPTCDTLAGPDGVQSVDLGIYASWWTNLRTNKSWQMISG